MQITKILVPNDLTELSEIATEYAVDLAQQLKIREVVLLNILIPAHVQTSSAAGGAINSSIHIAEQLNIAMLEKHQEIVDKHAARFSTPDVDIVPVVRIHHSHTSLNHFMKEFGAGLIVTGSRDKFSFLEILFGSETEQMIRKIDYPMIVLTGEPVPAEVKTIALAIDVELENEEQDGIDDVLEFANSLDAHLQLVYVITEDNVTASQAIDKLQNMAVNRSLYNYSINVVENHSLESGLQGFVRKYNPDMIAVITHGKGKIHNLIYGSNTGEVIKEIEIPVLVAKCK
jgi:nucleotide-binding universal stress UspA family protein